MKQFIKSDFGQKLLSCIGAFYIRFVYKTSRWSFINKNTFDDAINSDRPVIVCFWHQRLCMMPLAWSSSKPFQMLISSHSDGVLIARLLQFFNIKPVYGSSTRDGDTAAISLVRHLRRGSAIGITPDGPKGPAFKAAPGLGTIAKLAKAIIVPVSFDVKHKIHLKSWDQFLFPLPFTKGFFICGDIIDATQIESVDEITICIEIELNKI